MLSSLENAGRGLGISYGTVYELAARGGLERVVIGRGAMSLPLLTRRGVVTSQQVQQSAAVAEPV